MENKIHYEQSYMVNKKNYYNSEVLTFFNSEKMFSPHEQK